MQHALEGTWALWVLNHLYLAAQLIVGLTAGRRFCVPWLAAATGFCTGCEAYKLACLLRGHPFVACPLPPEPART